ncbi:MAG: radical SAM protein [Thermoanaerobaculales bacterium]
MRARPRLMLITPPYHSGVVEAAGVWMPLHFVYLAGHARAAGAEVRIYDAMSLGHSHDEIAEEIEGFQPDIVGVTAITAMEPDARKVCAAAKAVDRSTLTVLGNVHPTFCWSQILADDANVDVVVRSEGEETLAELVEATAAGADLGAIRGIALRENGVPVATPARGFAPDLDRLEPAWDLVDWEHYFYRPYPEGRLAIVSSSRGCQQQCSFCSQQQFWEQSWRSRSPESFVTELEMLRDRFDVRVAMLSDETPTVSRERWERLLALLIERDVGIQLLLETRVDDIVRDEDILDQYVEAGISHIYVGVESTSQSTLDLYKKDIKVEESRRAIELINQHGMVSETSFVLGTPEETAESIRATVDLAKWYAPDMAFFLAITPWPYAAIHEDLKDYIAVTDFSRYNLVEAVVKPERMTIDEMNQALQGATSEFFRDKFHRLNELPEGKRRFMVAVLKLLIEHSYLGEQMRAMAARAKMPAAMGHLLEEVGLDLDLAPGSGAPHGTSGINEDQH